MRKLINLAILGAFLTVGLGGCEEKKKDAPKANPPAERKPPEGTAK